MKKATRLFPLAGFVLLLAGTLVAGQHDDPGSKDHPLVSRYPGSYIKSYLQRGYDEFELPTGKIVKQKFSKTQHLEGKISYIWYVAPDDRSQLEIFRNYQSALRQAGFETLFACDRSECTDNVNYSGVVLYPSTQNETWGPEAQTRYLAARLSRPEGDAYVSLDVQVGGCPSCPAWIILYVVETKPMESGLVTVNAESLANDISRSGHSAVYGIYFDTGKADVKPESDAALKEISKLLLQDPKLKLYVVGHTDNQGALEMNMDLSMRRANSVAQALSSRFGVAAARLKALGDGPSAPVASNDSEDGRAKNRRVELVKQ